MRHEFILQQNNVMIIDNEGHRRRLWRMVGDGRREIVQEGDGGRFEIL